MRDMGIVQGSAEQAKELIVGKDTVYVHSDISKVAGSEGDAAGNMYQYHEIQYGKDEYIALISEKNKELEQQGQERKTEISEIQDALMELAEIATTMTETNAKGGESNG